MFRLIEFSGGVSSSNEILAHESYQLGLDALPMLMALVLLSVAHPGPILDGTDSSFPTMWKQRVQAGETQGTELRLLSTDPPT